MLCALMPLDGVDDRQRNEEEDRHIHLKFSTPEMAITKEQMATLESISYIA